MIDLERIDFHRIYGAWGNKGDEHIRIHDENIKLKDLFHFGTPFIVRYNDIPKIELSLGCCLKKARVDEALDLLMKGNCSKIDLGYVLGPEEKVGMSFSREPNKIERLPDLMCERACQFYTFNLY